MDTKKALTAFYQLADRQGWHHHHTPKNLACAISTEAGELLEHFQWLNDTDRQALSQEGRLDAVGDEIADVFMYLLVLCDKLGLDPDALIAEKASKNEQRQ